MTFWKVSTSLAALYGGSCVGMAAAIMHAWKGSLTEAALASVISAVAVLAFHALSLLVLNIESSTSKLKKLTAILWHIGSVFFVWTVLAGIFTLPLHFSTLAPIGGQLLMLGWLVLAIAAWRRS